MEDKLVKFISLLEEGNNPLWNDLVAQTQFTSCIFLIVFVLATICVMLFWATEFKEVSENLVAVGWIILVIYVIGTFIFILALPTIIGGLIHTEAVTITKLLSEARR